MPRDEKSQSNDFWVITGRIVSGVKQAAFFTRLDWVREQCLKKLGFIPYPGTLNLQVSEENHSIVERLQGEQGTCLIPPDKKFCTARTLAVFIGDVSGAVIIPAEDVRVHGKNIIEILAPLSLKDTLGVEDGDRLTLLVKKPKLQAAED